MLADSGTGGAPALSALAAALVAGGAALALADRAMRNVTNGRQRERARQEQWQPRP
jgi:hypothetical protein